jgi:Glycosyltransferase family 87
MFLRPKAARLGRVSGDSRSNKLLAILGIGIVAVLFAYYVSSRPMDFRVYYYSARGVFEGTRPVYGPDSGIGWPMHYRYPPLFLLLFAPLAMLPLGLSAAIWVVAKIVVLVGLVRAFKARGLKPTTTSSILISILFIGPYLIEEFRYGNAQFFVLALTIAGLLWIPRGPALAGASLAMAISIKVWPAFFLPYLGVRRDIRPVLYAIAFVVVLALLPAIYFGVSENFTLLGQWYQQESQIQLGQTEIWFPNQSLRGVLMRYLTVIDYSQVPDSNYPRINVAAFDPATVRAIWIILACAIYAGFLYLARRGRQSDGWLHHGLAFCLVALLEPFTQKYALAVLLWPAIIVAGMTHYRSIRILIYCATVFVLMQPLAPGAGTQRLLQVLGMDFVATLLLTIALVTACNLLKYAPPK